MGAAILTMAGCARPAVPDLDLPVLRDATVVAFWLGASDTIPDSTRAALQEEFHRSNQVIEQYLADTDIAFFATGSDSVLVHEEREDDWIVVLAGRSLPFGYALIEPGYEEEVLPGLGHDREIEAAIEEYFELEAVDSTPRKRIAARGARRVLTAAASPARGRSSRAWPR